MKKLFIPIISMLVFLALSGCTKKEESNPVTPTPTPEEQPPSFNVSAQPVTLATGDAGFCFFAFCITDDILLVKVVVKNPRGESVTYNAGSITVLQNQEFECEPAGTGYFKYLGTWSLTFYGNKAMGSKASFVVVKTISVTGKL